MMQKKILFPLIYLALVVLSLAFQLDGVMMIISLPVGLFFILIHILTGVQFVNIWLDIGLSLLLAFLIGWAFDIV